MLRELGIPVISQEAVNEENIKPDSSFSAGIRTVYKRAIPLPIREKVWRWRHKDLNYPYISRVSAGGVSAEFHITCLKAKNLLKDFGWEKGFLSEFLQTIRPDDVVWDIGANRGLYTVFAAKKAEQGRVISFEPDSAVFPELERNVALNRLNGKVLLQNYALGNEIGERTLYTDNSSRGKSACLKPVKGYAGETVVSAFTSDYLIETGKVPPPTVVKMDVEGAEGIVIAGMQGLLAARERPRDLFVEVHTPELLEKFGTDARSVCGLVTQAGYKALPARERATELLCHFAFV